MNGNWIQRPKGDTAVVFVHGLLSDAETCWRHKNGTYWPHILQSDDCGGDLGIYTFSYRTSKTSGSYEIGDAVDALREFLEIDGVTASRNLVFVCHSMGGIIVRKYIVQQQVDLIQHQKNIGLFLLATPSLGSRYSNILMPLIVGMGHSQAAKLSLSESSGWLNELDSDFKNLKESGKLKIIGKELVEDTGIFWGRFGRQIVERFSGARYFANPFKVPGSDHFSIAKISKASDIQHKQLCVLIREVKSESRRTAKQNAEDQPPPIARPHLNAEISVGCDNAGERGREDPASAAPKRPVEKHRPPVPFLAPPPPYNFVDRPEITRELKSLFQSNQQVSSVLVVSALQGLGGIGKTALAAYLAHDPDIRACFPDGVLWATLGQTPDIQSWLNRWIQALGDFGFTSNDAQAASSHLRSLLYNKSMLLVVDDAWSAQDARLFLVGGPASRVVLTTRIRDIASGIGAELYELDLLTEDQALALVERRSGQPILPNDVPAAKKLAGSVGYLPLALELVAAQLARGVSWGAMIDALDDEIARLEALESPRHRRSGEHRLEACFNLSLDRLRAQDEAAWRSFVLLGTFPEDTLLNAPILSNAFGLPLNVAEDILGLLFDDALIMRSQVPHSTDVHNLVQSYRLHDLLFDIARRIIITPPEAGLGLSLSECNRGLVSNYRRTCVDGQWSTLPNDGYIHRHLFWHLRKADLEDEMHKLLDEERSSQNGWYVANDNIGQISGFQEDLEAAARLSLADAPATEAALRVFQYGLCRASVNSIAANSPPELMEARIKHGAWTPLQALAYARLIPDRSRRLECFSYLMPLQEPAAAREIFNILHAELAARVQEESEAVVGMLARDFPPEIADGIYEKVFDSKRFFGISRLYAEAVAELAPYLPPQRILKSFNELVSNHTSLSRIIGLSGLLPYLPTEEARVAEEVLRRDTELIPQSAGWARTYSRVCLLSLECRGVSAEESYRLASEMVKQVRGEKQMLSRILPFAGPSTVIDIYNKYGRPSEAFVRKASSRMIQLGEDMLTELFDTAVSAYHKAIVAATFAAAIQDKSEKSHWIDLAMGHTSTIADDNELRLCRYMSRLYEEPERPRPHIKDDHFIRDSFFILSYLGLIFYEDTRFKARSDRHLHLRILEGTGERILRGRKGGRAGRKPPFLHMPTIEEEVAEDKAAPSIASPEVMERLDAVAAGYEWERSYDLSKAVQVSENLGTYASLYVSARVYSREVGRERGWGEWIEWLSSRKTRVDGGLLSCMALQETPLSMQDFFQLGQQVRDTDIGSWAIGNSGQPDAETLKEGLSRFFSLSGRLDRPGLLHELFFLQPLLHAGSESEAVVDLSGGVRLVLNKVGRWWP